MSFLDWFSGLTGQMSADMAIDLGTANTLVAITGEGIVINEPSVVAIEKSTQRVLAVGHEAKNMINHTPDAFSAEHPLKDGVIADYDVTEAMISAFINKAAERKYPWQPKPRIVVCIPCGYRARTSSCTCSCRFSPHTTTRMGLVGCVDIFCLSVGVDLLLDCPTHGPGSDVALSEDE